MWPEWRDACTHVPGVGCGHGTCGLRTGGVPEQGIAEVVSMARFMASGIGVSLLRDLSWTALTRKPGVDELGE